MSVLEDNWREATGDFSEEVCNSWLARIEAAYGEPSRAYCNQDSLLEKLEFYQEIKDNLKNPRAVLLAIFFQHFEYDPKALDGEDKNLEHFGEFVGDLEIPEGTELIEDTRDLLKVASTHSTEAHKIGGAYGGEDAHYLLDLDMAILGAGPDKYADYREKIRNEYSFLSEPIYTALRLKVLQNFLQIPNIFATKEFREKFEEQARTNIQSEIDYFS